MNTIAESLALVWVAYKGFCKASVMPCGLFNVPFFLYFHKSGRSMVEQGLGQLD